MERRARGPGYRCGEKGAGSRLQVWAEGSGNLTVPPRDTSTSQRCLATLHSRCQPISASLVVGEERETPTQFHGSCLSSAVLHEASSSCFPGRFPQSLRGAAPVLGSSTVFTVNIAHLPYCGIAARVLAGSDRGKTHSACKFPSLFPVWSSSDHRKLSYILVAFVVHIRGWLRGQLRLHTALAKLLLAVLSSLMKARLHVWEHGVSSTHDTCVNEDGATLATGSHGHGHGNAHVHGQLAQCTLTLPCCAGEMGI